MATVLQFTPVSPPPDGFTEALNGLGVGLVSLAFTRRALAQVLAADAGARAAVRMLLEEAYGAGRLAPEEFEILAADLAHARGEEAPTDWSEEAPAGAAPPTPARRPAGPGWVLRDRYVLQARLASGGMSRVFKALDRRALEAGASDPWVAIKLVEPTTLHYADALRLLQKEAALGQELVHPNVARVIAFDREGDNAFLILEWLEGESLAELLTRQRHRPVAVAETLRVVGEIGAALAFAHERGITHADVKPGNVFLTRDGGAKLLDFGLARAPDQVLPAAASEARTPAYASCEVLEGLEPVPQDDVYSLACVAYRMLAGRRAFGHHDALAAEDGGRGPAPIAGLDPRRWGALERALAFRRGARTPDVATFLDELGVFDPPGRRGAGLALSHVLTRRGGLWAGATAGVLALALALAWQLGDRTGDGRVAAPAEAAAPPVEPAASGPAATAATRPGSSTAVATAREAPAPVVTASAPPGTERGDAPAAAAARKAPAEKPRAVAERPTEPRTRGAAQPAPPQAPAAAASVAAAAKVGPPAPAAAPAAATRTTAPAGAVADTGTPATATALVPLASLEFRRYVEPQLRGPEADATGWVEVTFVVGTDGVPRDIRVLAASPAGRFERTALAAVRRWRFEPPREAGVAVERRTGVRLRFEPES
jgi:TonB family protein